MLSSAVLRQSSCIQAFLYHSKMKLLLKMRMIEVRALPKRKLGRGYSTWLVLERPLLDRKPRTMLANRLFTRAAYLCMYNYACLLLQSFCFMQCFLHL